MPRRLLFLGRISPWKAPDVAIRALAPLRELGIEATLTIAGGSHFGEDEYAAKVEALAEDEPGVSLLGHGDDVQALLASHDVLVHCSTVPEPFGQVIVQGLAAGLPVVATDHGGPPEIVGESPVPMLYAPGDQDQLAAGVRRAAGAFAMLNGWARGRAAEFSDDVVARQADRALSAVLGPAAQR